MEIDEALRTYLLTQAGLTALISQRIFPNELPQGITLPAVTYIQISDIKEHTLTGQLELEHPMIQYTVYAALPSTARPVANQIKSAMKDYSGTLSGLVIQKMELQNELSGLESSSDGTIKTYTVDLEYEINYIHP